MRFHYESTPHVFSQGTRARSLIIVAVGTLLCVWTLIAIGFTHFKQRNIGAVVGEATAVKILAQRDGDVTRFYVNNSELSEVTVTFDFCLDNLKSDVKFPYDATFGPGQTLAFTLSSIDNGAIWQYSYTNYYKLGSSTAEPDSYVYQLPYDTGKKYRVTQGYDGGYSHKGSNKYAIDWKMPEGTPVRAARGGLVVRIKDDSDVGGSNIKYDSCNNYVLIRHEDGTLGHYCHLLKGGVRVSPGQTVKAGEIIALSGNTGYSSGPHLHFSVFKTRDGRERESIPVKFRLANGEAVILVEGRKYEAGEIYLAETPHTVQAASAPSRNRALP